MSHKEPLRSSNPWSQHNDPYLNRFQQPDSVIPGAANPQAFNRYSYVLNSPLNFADPSGNNPECGPDGIFCDNNGTNDEDYAPMEVPVVATPSKPLDPTTDTGDQIIQDYPTYEPWQQPNKWDMDPSHPDYWVMSASWNIITASFEIDRYGEWYIGIGPSLDVLSTFFEVPLASIRIGNVDGYGGIYQDFPGQINMETFLTGLSFNGGGGILGGASLTWVPGAGEYVNHTSTEAGIYFPGSLGVSATYTVNSRQIKSGVDKFLDLFK
jgi:hypothetical protein